MGLEGIVASTKECAASFWWRLHDDKNYEGAGAAFAKQEEIIYRQTGRQLSPEALAAAEEHFASALTIYDQLTVLLKAGTDSKTFEPNPEAQDLEIKIRQELTDAHLAIGSRAGAQNAGWWIAWARTELAGKRQRLDLFKKYEGEVISHLTDEHVLKYGFDIHTARGLATSALRAMYLGHNKKDWPETERLLGDYYTDLLTALAKRQQA